MSPGALGIVASARVTGGLRHVELACFELLGRHAPANPWPAGAGFLASAALAHAWRASQLEALLPVSVGLPAAKECTVSPGEAADEALSLLAGLAETDPDAFLDAVVQALHPALDQAYRSRERSLQAAGDAALARTLRRVRADLAEARQQGEAVLARPDRPPHRQPSHGAPGAAGRAGAATLSSLLDPARSPFLAAPSSLAEGPS